MIPWDKREIDRPAGEWSKRRSGVVDVAVEDLSALDDVKSVEYVMSNGFSLVLTSTRLLY